MKLIRPKQLELDNSGSLITKPPGGGVAELPAGTVGQILQVTGIGEIGWVSGAGGNLAGSSFNCPASVAVTDVVYFSSSNTVDKASSEAGVGQTGEAIGVVLSKPTSTTCFVVFAGKVGGFSGLIPGNLYFQDPTTPGGVSATPPSAPGELAQRIGIASSATELVLKLGAPVQI